LKDHDINQDLEDYKGRETLGDLTIAENYNSHLVEMVLARCSANSQVLDFGAGNGSFAARLAANGMKVSAYEPDKLLIEEIRQRDITVVDSIETASQKFDVIYSLNVLEHIKDDVGALVDLSKHLEKAGQLVIYVPALEILYSKFDLRIGHYRRYSMKRLRNAATSAGLSIKLLEYHDPVGFFAALAYRILDNSGNLKSGSIKIFDRFLYPLSRSVQPITAKLFGKNLLLVATLSD
jgi:SAM-dependent methyltransferase